MLTRGYYRLLLRNTLHYLYNPVAYESCTQFGFTPPQNSYHAYSISTRLPPFNIEGFDCTRMSQSETRSKRIGPLHYVPLQTPLYG